MYTDSTRQPILNDQWYVHLETGTKYPPGYPRNLIPGLHPVTLVPAPTGNVVVSGFTINDNYEQVWDYRDKTRDEINAELLPALTNYRYGKEIGGLSLNGVTIQTDRESRPNLIAAKITAASDPEYTIVWKTDSGFVPLNAQEITAVADAVRAHVENCFKAELAVTVDISNYATQQEVFDAFDQAYAEAAQA